MDRKHVVLPSDAAQVAEGLCLVLVDLVHQEGRRPSRSTYKKMCAVVLAADHFVANVSTWFATRTGEEELLLERLMERYSRGRGAPRSDE